MRDAVETSYDVAVDDRAFDLKRVVVLDDEPAMLRTHARVLQAHGFRPVLLRDPHEALDEVRARVPGVLVVDLMMPAMSGLELVARLRTELGRACPPAVLVSANLADLAPMERIMFDALYSKPYSVDAYVASIRSLALAHHERRRAQSDVHARAGGPQALPGARERDGHD